MLDTNILLNPSRFHQRDLFFIIFAPHISLIRFHFSSSSFAYRSTGEKITHTHTHKHCIGDVFSRLHISFYNICSVCFDEVFNFFPFFFSSFSLLVSFSGESRLRYIGITCEQSKTMFELTMRTFCQCFDTNIVVAVKKFDVAVFCFCYESNASSYDITLNY